MLDDTDTSAVLEELKTQSMLYPDKSRAVALKESSESNSRSKKVMLEQIIESSLNEIYVFDAQSLQFLNVNHGARHNLGYTVEEPKTLRRLP